MGDRCYMEITCLKKDQDRFKALGFTPQLDDGHFESLMVVMVDEEANYAHAGHMPGDIPYHGRHGGGCNYGPGLFACDGKQYAEVQSGFEGGFIVQWNHKTHRPTAESLRAIRRYRTVRIKVLKVFEAFKASPATPGMKTITIRRLDLQFDANQITKGHTAQQAHKAIELINETLQREPFGLSAQLIAHPDEIEIELDEADFA